VVGPRGVKLSGGQIQRTAAPSFPPWKIVYEYFRRLSQKGIWQQVLAELVKERGIRQGLQVLLDCLWIHRG
ncbi:MAG: hypothetical protein AAF392_01710, partial [Bacteroidota bacterium]